MQLRLRRLNAEDHDAELYFGVIMVPLLCLVSYLTLFLPAKLVPSCAFHRVTGVPCPTCGVYRCIEALVSGKLTEAFLTQPLVFAIIALSGLYFTYAIIVVLFRLPRLRSGRLSRAEWWILITGFILIATANWSYLIANGR